MHVLVTLTYRNCTCIVIKIIIKSFRMWVILISIGDYQRDVTILS